jgi:leucyl-tRNA synthetase
VKPKDRLSAPAGKTPANFTPIATNLRRATHKTIKGVADDIEAFAMNKAVAKVRELSNAIGVFTAATDDEKWALRESIETLIILMNPMMPHLAEELWETLGHKTLLVETAWPKADPALLVADSVTIGVQVNGKLRGQITVPANSNEESTRETALAEPGVQKALEGMQVRKVIVVPGRIVNVVAG